MSLIRLAAAAAARRSSSSSSSGICRAATSSAATARTKLLSSSRRFCTAPPSITPPPPVSFSESERVLYTMVMEEREARGAEIRALMKVCDRIEDNHGVALTHLQNSSSFAKHQVQEAATGTALVLGSMMTASLFFLYMLMDNKGGQKNEELQDIKKDVESLKVDLQSTRVLTQEALTMLKALAEEKDKNGGNSSKGSSPCEISSESK